MSTSLREYTIVRAASICPDTLEQVAIEHAPELESTIKYGVAELRQQYKNQLLLRHIIPTVAQWGAQIGHAQEFAALAHTIATTQYNTPEGTTLTPRKIGLGMLQQDVAHTHALALGYSGDSPESIMRERLVQIAYILLTDTEQNDDDCVEQELAIMIQDCLHETELQLTDANAVALIEQLDTEEAKEVCEELGIVDADYMSVLEDMRLDFLSRCIGTNTIMFADLRIWYHDLEPYQQEIAGTIMTLACFEVGSQAIEDCKTYRPHFYRQLQQVTSMHVVDLLQRYATCLPSRGENIDIDSAKLFLADCAIELVYNQSSNESTSSEHDEDEPEWW